MTEVFAESDPMSQWDNARLWLRYDGYRKRFAAPRETDVHSSGVSKIYFISRVTSHAEPIPSCYLEMPCKFWWPSACSFK